MTPLEAELSKPALRVTAWSYSRYNAYELCPLRFKLQFIDKAAKITSPAMERGDRIHKAIASYLTGKAGFPEDAEKFRTLLTEFANFDAAADKLVEIQWAYTREWKPTTWFGKDVYVRTILDAAVGYEDLTADVVDHKTGKKYESNDDQMELFAVSFFSQYKPFLHVTTRLWYIDTGQEEIAEFDRKDYEKLRDKWDAKVRPMLSDTVFAPRPNHRCPTCPFGKSTGGQCKFG